MGKTKRILSFFIALIMVLALVPFNAIVYAVDVETGDEAQTPSKSEPLASDINTEDAFLAALEKGSVVLGGNITLSKPAKVAEGKTATIDLNGYALTVANASTTYAIANMGTLTIKDSVGTGSVTARGIYNGYDADSTYNYNAKLTIESGTFNAVGENGGAAVFNYGVAELNGGKYTSVGSYSLNTQAGKMTIGKNVVATGGLYNASEVIVNGASISGTRSGCHTIYNWNAKLTVNGGDFYNYNSGNSTIMAAGTSNVEINGGTFGIKDGRVPGNGNTWTSCLTDTQNTASLVVNGGKFNGGFRVQGGTTMTINGGTFNDVGGSGYNVYNGGVAVVNGGTFEDAAAQSFANKYVAEGLSLNDKGEVVDADGNVVAKVELPTATVAPIQNNSNVLFGLTFSADSVTAEQLEAYGDYFADFVITFNKDLTLGYGEGTDGWLSGNYGDYGWVNVPTIDKKISVEANKSYRVMDIAAELLDKDSLHITYDFVVELVKEFQCGVYLTPEFVAENPDFGVEIGLSMFEPVEDENGNTVLGEEIKVECTDANGDPMQTIFKNEDISLELPSATVTLIENPDLSFGLTFEVNEITKAQLDYYGDWYADFTIEFNVPGSDLTEIVLGTGEGADGWLSGQYDEWSENWVNVPFKNEVIPLNKPIKVMDFAAKLMGKDGLKITYREVYEGVEKFNCGVYLTPEFIAENGNFTVSVDLAMFEAVVDENGNVTEVKHDVVYTDENGKVIDKSEVTLFDKDDVYVAAVAEVNGVKYADIQEAIKAAAPSGTVTLLSDVTVEKWIMISETLTIGDGTVITLDMNGLTIDGKGHTLTIKEVESANNGSHIFYDGDYNIYDLTINMGASVNGIGITSGTISNVTFIGGTDASGGAAIMVSDGIIADEHAGNVTIEGCTFKNKGAAIYFESAQNGLVVNDNTFEIPAGANVILLYGTVQFTNNTVISGRTVNVVSGSPVVTGNDFGDVRLKVYNKATATITNNKINNLVFNDATVTASKFADNTLSESAQKALDAVTAVYVAQVGEQKFESVIGAINHAVENGITEVKLLKSVRELMPTDVEIVIKNDLTITADAPVEVKFYNNGTKYDFVIDCEGYGDYDFTIGENVTFVLEDRVIWVGYYGSNIDVVVDGTLSGNQIWAGGDIYVNETGTLNSTGEAFVIRRGKTVFVDGGKVNANYFNILAGNIKAENGAVIESGALWIDNKGGYAGEGAVSITLWDSTLTVKGNLKSASDKFVNIDVYNSTVEITDVHGYGASVLDANTTLYVDGESGKLTIYKGLNNNGVVDVYDGGELIIANNATVTNNGSIYIDSISTISGPANMGVETEVANMEVEYVDGKYILVEKISYVASINGVGYASLQEALNAAAAGTGNVTVEILADIDLTNVDWTPVTVSAPGYPMVTVNGNGKTITGLNDMLFAGTWAGKSGLIINDLTIANSTIVNDENDSKGNVGVGAFIGFPQASSTIALNNCHLVNSTVKGGHWTGGLIGYAAGYAGTDGPVFMNLTINGCSVTGSTITGKGSVGGIIGHATGNGWTNVAIEETTVSGNTVTSTGSSTNKAGAVVGTIGAAGQATTVNGVEKIGGVVVSATVSGNTVTSNGTTITTIYGRQGSTTGMLEISGGSYDSNPIEENVSYAAPTEGYKIVKNENGTYGVVEDPAYGKVAMIGDTYYATLEEAIAAAKNGDEVVILVAGTYTVPSGKDITITGAVDGVVFDNIKKHAMGGASVTFNNVTFNYSMTEGHNGLQHSGKLVYNNCTFKGQVFLYGTSETFNNCTFNQTDVNNYNVWTYAADDVKFNGCTFYSAGRSLLIYSEGADLYANVVITDCDFISSNAVDGKAAIEMDSSLSAGIKVTIDAATTATGFGNGNVSGNSLWNNKKGNETAANNDITVVVNGVTVLAPVTYVAQIGNKKYTSLEDAIAAAQNGETVVLLANIEDSATIKVVGKSITINLAGYTISGTCNAGQASLIYIENNAALTVKDTVGEGKITYAQGSSNVGWTIDVEGKFVLESGTIELTGSWSIGYAVDVRPNAWGSEYTNPSVFVMNGGTILSSDGAVRVASSSADAHKMVSASFVMNDGRISAAWDGVFIQQSNAIYDDLSFTMNGGVIESALNPVRVYGPAPTGYVNDQNCMSITLAGGTMTYTGAEAQTWVIEGILRVGGGSSVKTIVENGTLAVSAAIAESATAPEGYVWSDNGDGTITLAERVELPKISFTNVSVVLETNIRMNWYFDASAMVDGVTYYAMIVKGHTCGLENEKPIKVYFDENNKSADGTYFFPADIVASYEMNCDIYITVYAEGYDEPVSDTKNTSVVKYAKYQLTYSNDAALRTLVVDMLNYGAAAQIQFNHDTDNLANNWLTEEQKSYATDAVPELENTFAREEGLVDNYLYSYSISVLDTIMVNYYYRNLGSYVNNKEALKVVIEVEHYFGERHLLTLTGDDLTFVKDVNGNYLLQVSVCDLAPADIDTNLNVKLYVNGELSSHITNHNISSFCYRALYDANLGYDAKLKAVYETLAKFGRSAYAYFVK